MEGDYVDDALLPLHFVTNLEEAAYPLYHTLDIESEKMSSIKGLQDVFHDETPKRLGKSDSVPVHIHLTDSSESQFQLRPSSGTVDLGQLQNVGLDIPTTKPTKPIIEWKTGKPSKRSSDADAQEKEKPRKSFLFFSAKKKSEPAQKPKSEDIHAQFLITVMENANNQKKYFFPEIKVRSELEDMLRKCSSKVFAVRNSTLNGSYSASLCDPTSQPPKMITLLIAEQQNKKFKFSDLGQDPHVYDSLEDLVRHSPVFSGFKPLGEFLSEKK
jgi:hypothetical protein